MKKLFAIIAMLAIIATGAFAMGFGIGYVQSANLNGLTFTFDPIPLVTIQAGVSLFNGGVNNPTISTKTWVSPAAEPAWDTETGKINASVNGGSFGVRGLFNLQRPTPNTKFYTGLGVDVLFLTMDVNLPEVSHGLKINGSGYAVDVMPLAGFEWRPKEIKNLGLYAEIGYDITIFGSLSGGYSLNDGVDTHYGKIQLNPNAYLGRTFWGLGVTWYF